ncbi:MULTISPECIES: tyrosine recombinase XerC [unclassified Wenzhouxiangella]|uniref:tyrosine recombinase XerC n=1 Tax=unclassified Wenzhouxiangella TaxID=2613841 RepID=UPI000E32C05F|nr:MULTISPECIES: tyrosine recombinase XerC [unclassified Wenzhouxiangella]RFF28270.1 tyrosine recombinase XerC [Wenzhouxiangella sp. 15181]RFP69372.1 tyrosine recombinase XerC [Wenzhouxiangella sp. 15190]
MNVQAAVSAFLAHAADEAGLSPATIDAYRRDLERLIDWCRKHDITEIESLGQADVRSFAASEHRRGLSPRSVQRRLSGLRRLFRYLRRERIIDGDPSQGVRAPKVRRKLPEVLDVDQVLALLNIPEEDELATRDRAVLELFYASGLRVSELAGLTWQQLDLADGLVRVLGKGRRERVVPVGRHAVRALNQWRRIHTSTAGVDQSRVFTSLKGRPLGVRAIQKRVAYWSQRQGLDQNVHPHQLRHSFASHILESSGDLRAVQELLGHANLTTTQIYTHLDFQHLAKVYDETHPRAKKQRNNSENQSDD